MAITFRDFFIGLSEQAPVVAQLVHDYNIWNYQRGMAERKFQLEKDIAGAEIAKSKSISQYYEKGTELDVARFNLTKEEHDATIDLKIRRAEAEADTAEHARALQKFETNVVTKPIESLTTEEKTEKLRIMNDRNLKNEETRVHIQQLIASASSEKAREIFYTEEAAMKRVQSLNDYMDTFEGWMTNPDQIPTFEKAISESVDENGKVDWRKIYENRKKYDTVPVFLRDPFMRIAKDRLDLANAIKIQNRSNAVEIRELLDSGDPKKIEIANLRLHRKKNDPIDYLTIEPILQGYVTYQDSLPENQQLKILQDYFDKFMERYAPTTIPDYTTGEEGGAFTPDVRVGEPAELPDIRTPYEKQTEETWRRLKLKKRTSKSLYGEY